MAGSEHPGDASQRRRSALLRREWEQSLYPQAAEAGGCLVSMRSGQAAAGDPDPERSQAEGARRPALGGQAFPYVWGPEWHPGGHGLHVHFIVARYVRQSLIREAWGYGSKRAAARRSDDAVDVAGCAAHSG